MVQIVRAEEKHVTEIGNLWWEFMKYHGDIDPVWAGVEGSEHVFIDEFLHPAMNDETSLVLLAIENGQGVGYSYSFISTPVKISKRDRYGTIHDMFISVKSRHSGIGEQMVKEIYGWFRSHNTHRVELQIARNNKIGESFWTKQGFSEIGKTVYRMLE